ncbi:helix-turn-helix domain-containing protein [Thioclava nitratireducens]|uniref:helix-turn-helix domain-containing protein n=1 Tax=Thioclava nitratireducens TaxID=1915078 RepID=UPI002481202B|nr:helix-turn-helix domain-containing protein [Thioclava nitratireducens]WGT48903.1 helix-turn-helix domain-containing protein [Thioclava nitratireducens]
MPAPPIPNPQSAVENWRSRALLSLPDAGKVLGISRSSLYKMANAGEVSLVRLGGRTLVRSEEVARLADGVETWRPSERATKARAAKVDRPTVAGKGGA